MKQLFFLILLILSALTEQAQVVESRVENYIKEKAIDIFLVYSFPCSGSIKIDSCRNDDEHFLIWKQNGKFYLKKFEYCKTFKTVSLDSLNPLMYYLKNKGTINKEEIKPPVYYEMKNNKGKIDTLIFSSTMSHSCTHKFQFSVFQESKEKYIDIYDLDFKVFYNGKKNINYSDNQKTRLKELVRLTKRQIEELNTKNRFEPE